MLCDLLVAVKQQQAAVGAEAVTAVVGPATDSPRNCALLLILQFKTSAPGLLDLQDNMHVC